MIDEDELTQDLYIDLMNIKDKQLRLPVIKHKWVARLIQAKRKLEKYKELKQQTRKTLYDKILSSTNITLSKTAIELKIEGLDEVKKITSDIEDMKLNIEYLEKVEKIFSTMHWEIKNIIELLQLERT